MVEHMGEYEEGPDPEPVQPKNPTLPRDLSGIPTSARFFLTPEQDAANITAKKYAPEPTGLPSSFL